MRKSVVLLFAMTLLGASSLVARADTTFYLNNVTSYDSGETASGYLTIDTSAGIVTGADINYVLDSAPDLFDAVEAQGSTGALYVIEVFDAAGNSLDFNLPNLTLDSYSGGDICSAENVCTGSDVTGIFDSAGNFVDFAASGSLSLTSPNPPSATPEPSSLALLGTGLLGAGEIVRRRRTA